jgi:hypothetical protein
MHQEVVYRELCLGTETLLTSPIAWFFTLSLRKDTQARQLRQKEKKAEEVDHQGMRKKRQRQRDDSVQRKSNALTHCHGTAAASLGFFQSYN